MSFRYLINSVAKVTVGHVMPAQAMISLESDIIAHVDGNYVACCLTARGRCLV